ncbi:MAG: GNAT family protein [Alphaproteobacteria bacterium]|nr:GNAT family protein [Alphaproteobacteria bacterium]
MTKIKRDTYFVRPLEKSDIPTISHWFVDLDDLSAFDRCMRIPLSLGATEKAWSDSIGNDGLNGKYWFAIDDKENQTIGIIGLESVSLINGDAVLPVCMAKAARNKGIGIRSAALMLDIAFQQLGLNRLTSYYRADNDVTRYLTERAGFRQEGCMRQAWFAGGRHVDMIIVGILRQEWMERRKTLAEELDPKTVVTFGRHSSGTWSWPPVDDRDDA